MSEVAKSTLLFSAVGVVYIGLGIPLLLDRVPPNSVRLPDYEDEV
jgi:hypothetical protein